MARSRQACAHAPTTGFWCVIRVHMCDIVCAQASEKTHTNRHTQGQVRRAARGLCPGLCACARELIHWHASMPISQVFVRVYAIPWGCTQCQRSVASSVTTARSPRRRNMSIHPHNNTTRRTALHIAQRLVSPTDNPSQPYPQHALQHEQRLQRNLCVFALVCDTTGIHDNVRAWRTTKRLSKPPRDRLADQHNHTLNGRGMPSQSTHTSQHVKKQGRNPGGSKQLLRARVVQPC